VDANLTYIGAIFAVRNDDLFHDVWEYKQITNTNVHFELKGVGSQEGSIGLMPESVAHNWLSRVRMGTLS
jgi:hypothetical protein